MWIAIAIVAVIALALIALVVTARSRATTGRLSRETRKRDEAAAGSGVGMAATPTDETNIEAESSEARARADEARRAIGAGGSQVPAARPDATAAVYEPVDIEELGVTRRQFFNRTLLAGSGLGLGAFGAAALAFLWPGASTGFGGKINVGTVAAANTAIGNKMPFYNATAKTYIVAYPKKDLPKAKKISAYTAPVIAGMEAGYVALYQRCVHLGCRVPWCQSSQWFECPCHGSKYNKVGEKVGGPAPRGLDRFVLTISGGNIIVDTGNLVLGPPIGTNTIDQSPEGPLCV